MKCKKSPKGYVYLIKCSKFYKIGATVQLFDRMRTLQKSNPYMLDIVNVIETDGWMWATEVEQYLHQIFDHRRIHGEWFLLSTAEIRKFNVIKDKVLLGLDLSECFTAQNREDAKKLKEESKNNT